MHGSWPEKMLAEGIGTFALVFVGTGAIVVDRVSGGAIGHVGIALCFGLTVMTMIYAVGDISGAHFNPAVTVGFWSARRLPGRTVPVYLAAQLLGAILASAVLRALFPAELDLGATRPGENIVAAFVLEGILTFFLMFVNGRKSEHRLFHKIIVFSCPGGRGPKNSTLYEKTQLLVPTRYSQDFKVEKKT